MFVALPVRQQKRYLVSQLTALWNKVKGPEQYFNINPVGEACVDYISELKGAKRRGTTRVVKAILKERSKAS